VAEKLKANTPGRLEVLPERGVQKMSMQADGADVTEVGTSSTKGGQPLVQLILRNKALVHTVVRSTAMKGLDLFNDPTLSGLTASATAKKIMV